MWQTRFINDSNQMGTQISIVTKGGSRRRWPTTKLMRGANSPHLLFLMYCDSTRNEIRESITKRRWRTTKLMHRAVSRVANN
jgi:hypothetical protein